MQRVLSLIVRIALIAAALACVVLACARIAANLSLRTPLQLVTSGAEQEALDSIWRFAHGRPVYTDPHAIPYTASCFNWLFYTVYGSAARVALHLLHLGDAWLPTLCRLLTLGIALTGSALLACTLRGNSTRLPRSTALALGLLAFFNPLCGFWIITARPDLGAAVLQFAGMAVFLRHLRDGRLRWIALAALALCGAWAFKQSALGALAGIVLTLLLSHRWRAFLLLAAIGLIGAAVPVAILGPDYRQQLYLGQIHSGFSVRWALQHFTLALVKMPLIAVALAGLAWDWKHERNDPAQRALGLILVATLLFELAASSKGGANDYYFIPLGVWSVLWIGLKIGNYHESFHPASIPNGALVLAALLLVLDVVVIFSGRVGTISCRHPRQPYEYLARHLAARPGPVFIEDTYGDLPWISPTSPHFVIAFNDELDQRAGVKFKRGGWPGLLAQGYFFTVVTGAHGSGVPSTLLARYRCVGSEAGWRYFERK